MEAEVYLFCWLLVVPKISDCMVGRDIALILRVVSAGSDRDIRDKAAL